MKTYYVRYIINGWGETCPYSTLVEGENFVEAVEKAAAHAQRGADRFNGTVEGLAIEQSADTAIFEYTKDSWR